MEWFEAIILGLVQGLTEFLPVSSSGHLIIGKELLGIEAADDLVFEVLVHAATVLSTIVVFRKQLWTLIKGFFKFKYNEEMDYVLKICVSMIPVFIVGVFFKDFVTGLFQSLFVVGVALMVTAFLLFFSDMASGTRRKMTDAEYNQDKARRMAEIDRILDKIKQSGYDSLSAEEKRRLFDQGRR